MTKKLREFKGNSLLDFPTNYIVLDVETTDFDYFYGDIIEVCAHKFIDHKLVDSFYTLIKPRNDIPGHIVDLTGITNEMVATSPSFKQISNDFKEFVGTQIVIGHNVNFDVNFVYDALEEQGYYFENDFVDTLRLSRILVKDVKNHKLQTLSDHFSIDRPTHRAEDDVVATSHLYCALKKINDETPSTLQSFLNRKRKYKYVRNDLSLVSATLSEDEIDKDHIFFNKNFAFTGRMDFLTKKEAAQLVANLGGNNQNSVTAQTDYLILGNLEYQQEKFGKKSSKHVKAESMQEKGHDIEIMTEVTFLEIVNDN